MGDPYRSLGKTLVYQNPWIEVCEHQISRGGQPGVYGVVEREDSVIVVPFTPGSRTLLLRQYRFPTDQYSWELPMGGVTPGESEIEAAKRELAEETGLLTDSFEVIGEYHAVPGLTPQRVTAFVAQMEDTHLEEAQAQAADEITTMRVLSLSQLNQMVQMGEITDGFTIAATCFLNLHITKQDGGQLREQSGD